MLIFHLTSKRGFSRLVILYLTIILLLQDTRTTDVINFFKIKFTVFEFTQYSRDSIVWITHPLHPLGILACLFFKRYVERRRSKIRSNNRKCLRTERGVLSYVVVIYENSKSRSLQPGDLSYTRRLSSVLSHSKTGWTKPILR